MKIKIVYIDDDDKDLKKYKRKFEEIEPPNDRFIIKTININKSFPKLIEIVKEDEPELFLIDFDLSKPKDDELFDITGNVIATALREKIPDIPIILFTRKSVFQIDEYSGLADLLGSIDDIVYKRDIFRTSGKNYNYLYELAKDYKKLRLCDNKNWENLLKLLKSPESDEKYLKLAEPPFFSRNKFIWSVLETSRWIRGIILKYPGILYDGIHASTYLGISLEEFNKDEFQEFFKKAEYVGVFHGLEKRWWKSRLCDIALKIMNDDEIHLPLRVGFPKAWERKNKIQIERSKCIFSRKSPAEWVCYILKKPMLMKHSLSYSPDLRPSVMDEARVSFKAIRTSNDVNDELFDELGKDMLKDIRKK